MAHDADPVIVDAVRSLILDRFVPGQSRPLVLGICGSQGSGKSTLSAILRDDLTARGLPTEVLSLDDIYKTRAERCAMASQLHPLLRTRGVPGTHDVSLALNVIASLERGEAARLPRFDKAADDRVAPAMWPTAAANTRIVIFEGWFVGARPATGTPDPAPLNALEAQHDADGRWRRLVEQALRNEYQALFSRLDALVLLAAPNFDVVLGWRIEQEHALRAGGAGMSDEEVGVFIQHYERLTRRILSEMPGYAHLVVNLDPFRHPLDIQRRLRFGEI